MSLSATDCLRRCGSARCRIIARPEGTYRQDRSSSIGISVAWGSNGLLNPDEQGASIVGPVEAGEQIRLSETAEPLKAKPTGSHVNGEG